MTLHNERDRAIAAAETNALRVESPAPAKAYNAPKIATRSADELRGVLASVNAATGFIPSP